MSRRSLRGPLRSGLLATISSQPLSQTLSGVSVNPLLKDLANHDLIAGHGDIVLDLASAGATLGAIKRGLSGTARLSFKDGVIKGIDLVESARAARASAAPDKPAALAANGAGKTDFSELSASFRIAEGVARTEDLAARSPVLRIIGNGSIDLAEGSMDYVATARIHGAATS